MFTFTPEVISQMCDETALDESIVRKVVDATERAEQRHFNKPELQYGGLVYAADDNAPEGPDFVDPADIELWRRHCGGVCSAGEFLTEYVIETGKDASQTAAFFYEFTELMESYLPHSLRRPFRADPDSAEREPVYFIEQLVQAAKITELKNKSKGVRP